VTPSARQGISRMMQSVGRRYVRCINDVYNRSGTLWEGRFKSALVDSDRGGDRRSERYKQLTG
jgi:putative transposase